MSGLLDIGHKVIELLNEQVEQGVDRDGNRYRYSTKPFALPAGKKKFAKRLFADQSKGGKLKRFTTAQGKMWYYVYGGYRSWRELNDRRPDGDFLQWSGQMMRSLTTAEEDGKVVVYFGDEESARKAFWLNVSGVGRSRKLWKFFGLTRENEQKLLEYAADRFARIANIDKMFDL